MKYKHTQIGYLIIVVFVATAILFAVTLILEDSTLLLAVFMIVVLALLASFFTLQTLIDENFLKIKFGYGLFKKQFLLKDIASATCVKNYWYTGWGIRVSFWPHMWIYNVSGFDAVEIKMKNGKIYRIGTDEPDNLKKAIQKSIE
jgi:prepilin signal peptidase PulO-like enzyme (type II secretory pathway)